MVAQSSMRSEAGSTSSTPNSVDLDERAREWLKLRIADHARLMGDNQRILSERHEAARRDERRQERLAAMLAEQQFNLPPGSLNDETRTEEPVDIRIDSPTVTHHYPQQPPPAQWSPWKTALVAAAVALALSGPIAAVLLLRQPARQPAATAPDTDTQYRLRFGK